MSHRSCVFCGRPDVQITNEHAWPNWIRNLFPPGPITIRGHRQPTHPLGAVKYVTHDDMGVTVNTICTSCNGGWMNDLEGAVAPLLTSPIRNGAPTVFTRDQQRVVATWCLKTMMVFEFTGEDAPFYSFKERNELRTNSEPPKTLTLVWLAHYVGSYICNAFGTRSVFDLEVDGHLMSLNAHYASVSLGQFAFQTFTIGAPDGIRGIAVPVKDSWEPSLALIWPCDSPVTWPPRAAIDDDGFSRFVRRFEANSI